MTKSLADIWAEANPAPPPPEPTAEEKKFEALMQTIASLEKAVAKLGEPKQPRKLTVLYDEKGVMRGATEE
jgi:hypothetical protein